MKSIVCILALYQVQCGHIFLLRLSAALNNLQPLPIVFSVLPSYAAFFSSDTAFPFVLFFWRKCEIFSSRVARSLTGGFKISDGWLFHLTGSGLTSSFSVMPSVIANWQQSYFCLLSAWRLPLEQSLPGMPESTTDEEVRLLPGGCHWGAGENAARARGGHHRGAGKTAASVKYQWERGEAATRWGCHRGGRRAFIPLLLQLAIWSVSC